MTSPLQFLPHGITVIDTGFLRPRFDAAYLIVDDGHAAFVETGTNQAVPALLQALAQQGLGVDAVEHVIVTHVHLDHAGGAGALMQQLPRARLVVHPRGARHMADPAQLMAGVRAVYGQARAERDYGTLVPVPAGRIVQTADGMTLPLGRRTLEFIDTPGHARHHHCVWDSASQGWFVGDTLGAAYEELTTPAGRYGLPACTPVQFDPVALRGSIERLLARQPRVFYLTHYGAVPEVQLQATQVLQQVDAMVAIATRLYAEAKATAMSDADRSARLRAALLALYLERMRAIGITLAEAACRALLASDVDLNAQGLEAWLEQQAAAGAS